MIIFSGVVSDEVQIQTMKKRNKYSFWFCAISSFIIILVGELLWFFLDGDMKLWYILSGVLIATVLLQLWNPKKKIRFNWEYHITIDTEKIIVESPLWPKPLQKPLKKVKKILDAQNCYYIIYADINNSIVCQKDLLVEGTIEEFEELFAGKIRRKNKQNK